VTVARYWNAVVGNLAVAFDYQIGLHVGLLWTVHLIALAGDTPPANAHGLGGGDDFAAVVCSVAEPDKINHELNL
jgi:hypothetical protein